LINKKYTLVTKPKWGDCLQYKYRDFKKLRRKDDLCEYIEKRNYNHGEYCHYTSLSVIDSILKNREFWLSCVNNFNDKKEVEGFENMGKKSYYSLCFATGVNENLSMWYLYSGLSGKGGRIRFKKSTALKEIFKNAKFMIFERAGNKKVEVSGSV
jgi:hypothetical protein